jgi:hypothetical protein
MRLLILLLALILTSCDDSDRFAPPSDPAHSSSWEIGPMVRGENRSPGSERVEVPGALLAVRIPFGDPATHAVGDRLAEFSAVTFPHGSLEGKTAIRARFRFEGAPDVRIVNSQNGGGACINAFFQRRGDDWSAKGKFETYRWYAGWEGGHVTPIEINRTYEMYIPLDGPWTATQTSAREIGEGEVNPAFIDAINNAERVGLVLGGGDGHAHGVYATGSATFILEEFTVL